MSAESWQTVRFAEPPRIALDYERKFPVSDFSREEILDGLAWHQIPKLHHDSCPRSPPSSGRHLGAHETANIDMRPTVSCEQLRLSPLPRARQPY